MEKTMMLVIDGCAPEYLNAENAPHIHRLCGEKGFFKCVEGAVPSVTNVNHACILSGLWPEDTHMTGNYFYNPETGETGFIEEKKFMKAETLLQRYKKAGCKTALLTVKGKILDVYGEGSNIGISVQRPDAEVLKRLGIEPPPEVKSAESTEWILNAAYRCIKTENPDFLYCTTNDYVMHHYSSETREARDVIKAIDRYIKMIYDENPERRIYITADHGMNKKTLIVNFQKLSDAEGFKTVCVPPLKDRYIENHIYQEGGCVYVYLKNRDEFEKYRAFAEKQPFVACALDKKEAAKRYRLPLEGIGDIVVFAAEGCAFGETEDIFFKTDKSRTHGSLYERTVPLAAINPVCPSEKYVYSKDIAANIFRNEF